MRRRRARLAVFLLLVVAIVVIAVALITGGDDGDDSGDAVAPTIASGTQLTDLAKDAGHTVYWAGERPGTRTEFEEDLDGNVYLRYLPESGNPASQRNSSLTIGSYPVGDAVAGLKVVAERPGATTYNLRAVPGSVVVTNQSTPSSVYVAYPDSAVQIEVYDPDPAEALKIILQGEIKPLG